MTATGLLRRSSAGNIEWIHQLIQERLAVVFSADRFSELERFRDMLLCPRCGNYPYDCKRHDNIIIGECYDENNNNHEYEIKLPPVPYNYLLKEKVICIDMTGAELVPNNIVISEALWDEGWTRLSLDIMQSYIAALYFAQNASKTGSPVTRIQFSKMSGALMDWEIWKLAESGVLTIVQEDCTSIIYVHEPPVNPSKRIYCYTLTVIRELSYEELDEPSGERIHITSDDKERYVENRRSTNLPIYSTYDFTANQKSKVFALALRYGGRVSRTWGPYSEVLAEFPGDAWDFRSYSTEQEYETE